MKIDRLSLFLIVSMILGVEAGFFDSQNPDIWTLWKGFGPEGILGGVGVRLLAMIIFREKS